jgi:hypothetical protein
MRYPKWCCQRCGEQIGYIGRFVELTAYPLLMICKSVFHNCDGLFSRTAKKVPEGKSNNRANDFPVL